METTNTNNQSVAVDTVAEDFKNSLFIVSLLINLTVFVTWMAYALA